MPTNVDPAVEFAYAGECQSYLQAPFVAVRRFRIAAKRGHEDTDDAIMAPHQEEEETNDEEEEDHANDNGMCCD